MKFSAMFNNVPHALFENEFQQFSSWRFFLSTYIWHCRFAIIFEYSKNSKKYMVLEDLCLIHLSVNFNFVYLGSISIQIKFYWLESLLNPCEEGMTFILVQGVLFWIFFSQVDIKRVSKFEGHHLSQQKKLDFIWYKGILLDKAQQFSNW